MNLDLDKLPISTKDLRTGSVIGYLTLLRRMQITKRIRKPRWKCQCSCGKQLTVFAHYLVRRPNPKSHCGCKNKTNKTIYNQEYRIWLMMKKRCTDETHVAYKYYGGRGIRVCSEWFDPENGFEIFLSDMGSRPSKGHSIDRIDVDGNYEAINVRWATAKEQAANTRAAKRARARILVEE